MHRGFAPSLLRPVFGAVLLCAMGPVARALILYDFPSGRTIDPGNGMPWGNVGSLNGATGIYLGEFTTGYWVITANHVGAGPITFSGDTYPAAAGTARQIGTTDILLFRLESAPVLPTLSLSTATPAAGTSVWMVGYGGGTKNWGTNTREGVGYATLGASTTYSVSTHYDFITGEAQGTTGDSGGAMFTKTEGTWMLAGSLSAVSGDYTIVSDLATYRNDIFAITGTAIPEPATLGLILGIGAMGVAVGRHRCHRAPRARRDPTSGIGLPPESGGVPVGRGLDRRRPENPLPGH